VIWSSNPSRVKRFAAFQNGQTGSGFYPASNSMGTGDYIAPEGKADSASHLTLTSN